ncbi:MAG: 6-bladed beta-propeller, partial [Candidatus Aminicenantaceae bacterium]
MKDRVWIWKELGWNWKELKCDSKDNPWIYIGLIVVLLVVCVSSTLASENASLKVTLEEVLSVGSLDDDTLFQWVGVTVDSYGQIYVTDAMDYSLKKFDADGKLLQKAGGKGQGPGEFLAP